MADFTVGSVGSYLHDKLLAHRSVKTDRSIDIDFERSDPNHECSKFFNALSRDFNSHHAPQIILRDNSLSISEGRIIGIKHTDVHNQRLNISGGVAGRIVKVNSCFGDCGLIKIYFDILMIGGLEDNRSQENFKFEKTGILP